MSDKLNKQLDELLKSYSEKKEQSDLLFETTMKEIDSLENTETAKFLRISLEDGKKGTLDVKTFIENAKKLKDAS